MKIAIIADTHDNLANLDRFFEAIAKREIEGLLHCGDVANIETLTYLTEHFSGEIKLACGNAEINREEFFDLAKQVKNLTVFDELGEWEIDGHRLAFIHKPDQTGELAETGRYDFIFHGHTHQPWIKQIGSVLIANPGALTGGTVAPTYTLFDSVTGRLELVRL